MEYVTLSNSDLTVSRIALGGWQIGGRSFGRIADEDVRAILFKALDLGITFFDLAACYGRGRAEELAGRFLPRDPRITVATKCGLRWSADLEVHRDLSRRSIREEVEQSLRRLRRDEIDLYLAHWPDPHTAVEESFAELESLRREGKVRHLGLCNYGQQMVAEARKHASLSLLQSRLNLLEQETLPDLRYCRESDLTFAAHSSLATGLLTGKYERGHIFTDARARYAMYRGSGLEQALEAVEPWRGRAQRLQMPLMGFALRFLLDLPGMGVAVIGTRAANQLQELVRAVPFPSAPFGGQSVHED